MGRRLGLPPVVAVAHVAACATLATFLLAARRAGANPCSGPASPCINDDALWPSPGPARFVAVGSSETVARHQVGFGLVTSYLSRPIARDPPAVDEQVDSTFLWAYGVTDRLELDLASPLTLAQSGAGLATPTGRAGLKSTAVRDLRFGFAYAFLAPERTASIPSQADSSPGAAAGAPDGGWGLAGRLEISAPTGDSAELAGEGSAVLDPDLAVSYRRRRWYFGLDAGARLRPQAEHLGARIGTQLSASAGIGFDVLSRDLLSVQVEGWALPVLASQRGLGAEPGSGASAATPSDQGLLVPAEWQLSVRSAPLPSGDLGFFAGGGGALPFTPGAVTMARLRVTFGVRWAPRAVRGASEAQR